MSMAGTTQVSVPGIPGSIVLTQGKIALVDKHDLEWLSEFNWCAVNKKTCWYAVSPKVKRKRPAIYMHQLLLPTTLTVDHINGNGLDNRRSNLRKATVQQNNANRRGFLKFKGVCEEGKGFRAQITVNGKSIYLGNFPTEIEAAIAYNTAAYKAFGEFARLNNV